MNETSRINVSTFYRVSTVGRILFKTYSSRYKNDLFVKRPEVTIKIQDNLQNAFNNTDNEMTMFAKKNKRDQQGIPQIHIIKSIAIPIAEENKKLKDNLETTHKRKDNLNSLILDMSTRNKNRLCDHKNWVDNKMDEINDSISSLDKNIKKADCKIKHLLTKVLKARLRRP